MTGQAGESRAAERTRWLSELAEAIDRAQRLLWSLAGSDLVGDEAEDLFARIDAVRSEIEALRRGATAEQDDQLGDIADWLASLGWAGNERAP